eukprot:s3747_g1.t1
MFPRTRARFHVNFCVVLTKGPQVLQVFQIKFWRPGFATFAAKRISGERCRLRRRPLANVAGQDDFSAIGFVVTPLRLARVDLQAFAGHKKDWAGGSQHLQSFHEACSKDTRFLHNLCRNWKEVLAIDVAYDDSSKGHEKVLEITLCGELDKVMALKEAVCAFAPLIERSESYQSSELAKNTKLLKEILQEIVERGLAQPEEDTMIPHSGDQSEVSKLQKYMRRRGDELLRSLGPAAVLKLLGLTGRRLTGMVKDLPAVHLFDVHVKSG